MEFIYIFQAALLIEKFIDQNKIGAMFVLFKKNRIYFHLKPKKMHKSVKGQLPYILPDRVGDNQMLEQQKNFYKGKVLICLDWSPKSTLIPDKTKKRYSYYHVTCLFW